MGYCAVLFSRAVFFGNGLGPDVGTVGSGLGIVGAHLLVFGGSYESWCGGWLDYGITAGCRYFLTPWSVGAYKSLDCLHCAAGRAPSTGLSGMAAGVCGFLAAWYRGFDHYLICFDDG